MDVNVLKIWLGVGITFLAFIGHLTGFFKCSWKTINSVYQKIKAHESNIVFHLENTIFPNTTTWWSLGNRGDNPGMQISGNFRVTNNTEKNILLTGCYIKKFNCRGQVLTCNTSHRQYDTQFSVSPNFTTKIAITFWIEPSQIKVGNDFVSDIAILDNFGKKHWIKKIKFSYIG